MGHDGITEASSHGRALAEEFKRDGKGSSHRRAAVDAGLNLNGRAFDQLEIAAERTGFFHNRKLICEVYPAKVTDQHIRFLSSVGNPLVGVGLQSFDNEVLAHVERSFDEQRFEDNMARLTNVSRVAIEIIMGLPGDNPEQFRRSFHRARTFPCALRVLPLLRSAIGSDGPITSGACVGL